MLKGMFLDVSSTFVASCIGKFSISLAQLILPWMQALEATRATLSLLWVSPQVESRRSKTIKSADECTKDLGSDGRW